MSYIPEFDRTVSRNDDSLLVSTWCALGVRAADLLPYRQDIERLYAGKESDGDGKHDIGHITRVLVLAADSSAYTNRQGIAVDWDVIAWSVILHDTKSNHHDIPDHGVEAANVFAPWLARRFPLEKAKHIEAIIRWHSHNKNQDVPEEVKTPEFWIVTAADALDLVRIGDGRDIHVGNPIVWELRRAAQVLYRRSMTKQTGDAFEKVLSTAKEIGLLTHCA